jgi:type I restriction enzyme M protein
MWNQPGYDATFYVSDTFGRFVYGQPPARSADWGWLQHILASLRPNGRAAVVLDAAAVTRGSGDDGQTKEKAIRREFVDHDLIEAVILLPDNLFYNTTAQGIIVVLNQAKPSARKQAVLLIDASDQVTREKPKNLLSKAGAAKIADVFAEWRSEARFSRVITLEECIAKDYNLNPARYVAREVERISVDLGAAQERLTELRQLATSLDAQATQLMSLLRQTDRTDHAVPDDWGLVPFGDVAEFALGRTPSRKRSDYFSTTDGHPWVTISDMAGHSIVTETKERVSDEALRDVFRGKSVQPGTLLMTIKLTVGRTAFIGVEGVHNEAIVSILPDEREVLAKFLYYLLPLVNYREHQDRAVKGQTINLGKLKKLQLALPPVGEQRQIVEALDVLERLVQVEREISDRRAGVRDELIQRVLRGQLRVVPEQ